MEREAESQARGKTASQQHNTALSQSIIGGIVACLDAVIVVGLGLLIYVTYVGWASEHSSIYLAAFTITAFLILQTFYQVGLYKFNRIIRPAAQIGKIVTTLTMIFLALVTFTFALKISAELSRVWAFSWFLSATMLMILIRFGVFFLVQGWAQQGKLTRNILLFGGGKEGERILEFLSDNPEPWNRVMGVFDDRRSRLGPEVAGHPIVGNLDDLIRFARKNRSDDVLVALPWIARQRIEDISRRLQVLPTNVHLCADLVSSGFLHRRVRHHYGVPVLNIADKPVAGWNAVVKMCIDFGLSSVTLALTAPLMLIIALAIKLESRGPVFFQQKRYGFNNQLIKVLKFRTMYVDQQDDDAERLTSRGDPRVTRVGAILRRSSLDELPQLINVLRGEMSIVGPRPHALKAKAAGQLYEEAVAQYAVRHKVKPGITGWAQVNGWRGETDTHEKLMKRVEHDLYYIEHWSFLLDVRIILKTPLVFLKNAY